jgi:O-methyltransferase
MLEALRNVLAAGELARSIRRNHLTFSGYVRLGSLQRAANEVRNVPGAVVECGVALGGSGILLGTLLNDRDFHGYDVFGEFPAPGPKDPAKAHKRYAVITSGQATGIGGDTYRAYLPNLLETVSESFASYGVKAQLHKGLFEDTLNPAWPVALAHIDCDWYDSVKVCLERITPWLSPGARVIIDDYYDYDGARKATGEYLAEHPEVKVVRKTGHLVLGYAPTAE